MKEIGVSELQAWRSGEREHQLIDIREEYEFAAGNLGGTHIPMGDIIARHSELRRDVPVVLQCRSGGRSAAVLVALEEQFGMDNLYNLKGGATAWAAEVDPSMEVA